MASTPISNTREFIEENFGEAIDMREQLVLPHLAASGGLGPPDLCWIRKVGWSAHDTPWCDLTVQHAVLS